MKKILLILIALSSNVLAQDSIPQKKFSHELGFNSVLLIKQIISNNPASTLPQLPYQIIYTLNFKEKFGIRAGLGFNQSRTETTVLGNPIPRVTQGMSSAYRLGLNMNFVKFKKITANAFVDFTMEQNKIDTETSSNSGSFSSTQMISAETSSLGPEIGFGIKYSFNKHIAIYTEVPLQFALNKSSETDTQTITDNFNGGNVQTTTSISDTKGSTTKIFLPTTLFLSIIF
ncbi:MAG: hypothetical protein K0Q95_3213 [Bacteroidota bacterium]|jgi:hypothetical protein|nr:hypothetical protein [Bacteroidota bacterium]